MLRKRIVTAFILIPLTLLLMYFLNPIAFAVFTGIVLLLAAWEWTGLMEITSPRNRFFYLLLIIAMMVGMLFLPTGFVFFLTASWWVCALLLVVAYHKLSLSWMRWQFAQAVMGIFVLVPCWGALNFVRQQENGFYILLFIFALVWSADSVAYFVGKKFGKHRLAPKVSPGKSIEGFVGALLACIIVGLATFLLTSIPLGQWWGGIFLVIGTVCFSVVGDLFESLMKRQAQVKDSGQLLPGHGGLLDRIDSLTAAAPMFIFLSWALSEFG